MQGVNSQIKWCESENNMKLTQAVAVLGLTFPTGLLLQVPSSLAVTFSQTEVNQSKVVAVAIPRKSGSYTLLVLEQLSNKKSCWRESGSSPARIDPLLLNFNFTGICGRSTDSNGYSIRMRGKDAALDYRLSFQKRKDDLILMGIPYRSESGKLVEVGRTHGLKSGFLKIILNPGWRFTKRVYNGKKLGHIYFSRDTAAPAARSISSDIKPKATKAPSTPPKTTTVLVKTSASRPIAKASNGSSAYRVMVVSPDLKQQAKLRTQKPKAFRMLHKGKTVMQVGVFGDRKKAESLKSELKHQGFKVWVVPSEGQLSSMGVRPALKYPLGPYPKRDIG
jgi:N-acetylmuramoyl-L-alanine amidase